MTNTTRSRKKLSPAERIWKRFGKLIALVLAVVVVVLIIVLICQGGNGKSSGKSSSSSKGSNTNYSQSDTASTAATQTSSQNSDEGEGINGFNHVPELTAGGYVVHAGNEREAEWFLIPNQSEASLNTYENKYWSIDENGIYTYTEKSYTSMMGVDLSGYTGTVDWNQLAASGVQFAIIRYGYRGYGTGQLVEDEMVTTNVQGALNAGIKVGLYFVSQAINTDEAAEEAQMCLDFAANYDISMPIYYDMEEVLNDTARTDGMTKDQYTANAVAFCSKIESGGHKGGIYANQVWFTNNLDLTQVDSYDIWFAKYTGVPDYPYKFDMWQYSETGSLAGCDGAIDLNVRMEKNE